MLNAPLFIQIYVWLAVLNIASQIIFSLIEYAQRRNLYKLPEQDYDDLPRVNVVIPAYMEGDEALGRCIRTVAAQTYPNLRIFVACDGWESAAMQRELIESLSSPNLVRIENGWGGKRAAMKSAFDVMMERGSDFVTFHTKRSALEAADDEIIVTMDSDTSVEDPMEIRKLIQPLLVEDEQTAAVTGDVQVYNKSTNLLTRLISLRYWTAFNQERAAQSLFGVMMCCSGPFTAYRASAIREVKDEFASQMFGGKECTFGDDRHLTNLLLERGYRTRYNPLATCQTVVPDTMKRYLKQQLRWNKSFYREMLVSFGFMFERKDFQIFGFKLPMWKLRHNPYFAIELVLQAIMPFMLMAAIVFTIVQSITVDPVILLRYGVIIALVGFVRSLYGLIRTRNPWFVAFITYGFIHVLCLIPVRIMALFTLTDPDWLTRPVSKVDDEQYQPKWLVDKHISASTPVAFGHELQIVHPLEEDGEPPTIVQPIDDVVTDIKDWRHDADGLDEADGA